ncbi:MAG TPA: sugar kinase [Anaerolineae bacterium]|nr:sugar kinase [Anaerolineae bacterium]
MSDYDLLIAGEINPDLILTGDVTPAFGQAEKLVEDATLTVGSSSVIVACGAARLGLRVAFIGLCGDDLFGQFMLAEMQRRGVNTSHVIVRENGRTGLSIILNRGDDRAILTFPGLISALRAADIPDALLARSRHLHIASYFLQTALQPDLPGLFQRAHTLGLTTSLDPNYDPSGRWEGFDQLLPHTDLFLPNQQEALALTQAPSVEDAAQLLARRAGLVAVKLGAAGALAARGETLVRATSIPVQVADTVGAGDSFDAGFLFGYLQGWPLEKTLRLATVCGALSTRQPGGVAAQPTLEEALVHL